MLEKGSAHFFLKKQTRVGLKYDINAFYPSTASCMKHNSLGLRPQSVLSSPIIPL